MSFVVDKELLSKPPEKHWITYIKQRVSLRKKKNFLGFISGPTGSGKSWSTLKICEDLDPEFDIDQVVFGGIALMELINSGKLQRGSAICFEEVGVEMNNRNWQSVTNKMLNYLMQTFRWKGFILIMNSPYMDFVDIGTRKLFHAEMSTCGIDFKACEVRLKPQLIQYNSRMQKFYYKRLKVAKKEGMVPISIWRVGKPSKELLVAYEVKKQAYSDNLNKTIFEELNAVGNKGKKKIILTDIQQDTLDLLKKGLTTSEIAKERHRAERVVYETIKYIRKKGYKIIPVYPKGLGLKKSKILRYDVIENSKNEKKDLSGK